MGLQGTFLSPAVPPFVVVLQVSQNARVPLLRDAQLLHVGKDRFLQHLRPHRTHRTVGCRLHAPHVLVIVGNLLWALLGGLVLGLAIAVLGFLWIAYLGFAKFNEARQGKAEWAEVGVLGVVGAIVLIFASYLLTEAAGVI